MKSNQIIIRDPFVMVYEGRYYMYGTRSFTCWGDSATGFDVYVSEDLEEWSEPIEVFHCPEDFWGKYNFWAPEVYRYRGAFYMFATFNAKDRCKGTAVLRSESSTGPFVPHSDGTITPDDWECLDGTFYLSKDGTPYMVFCHEWQQIRDGQVCSVRMSEDLKSAAGEPTVLFSASEGRPWVREIARHPQCYVTDGPFLFRTPDGILHMLWSSFGELGYTESLAYSDNNDITGKWSIDNRLLFEKDGGHGMIFRNREGELILALHSPNEKYAEHPVFYPVEVADGRLQLKS